MNFVDKSLLSGIMYVSCAQHVWEDLVERYNKIDGSRTFNLHKEIAILTQGTNSVSVYFTRLKGLWKEFEAMVPAPSCDCDKSKEYMIHLRKLKLFQFLMGLNNIYMQERSQIILMSPLPYVNQAYSMIMSRNETVAYSRNGGSQKFKKNSHLFCDCKLKNHTRENCYKLVGYPQDSKFKKRGPNTAYNAVTERAISQDCGIPNYTSHSTNLDIGQLSRHDSSSRQQVQLENYSITKDQYRQLIQFLSKAPELVHSANVVSNMTGINSCLTSNTNASINPTWIIDTGVINHIVADLNFLDKITVHRPINPKKVSLPNGDISLVESIGSSTLPNNNVITGVFYLPHFKFNLFSVSKLTRKLQCSATFFPNFCVFQDLSHRKVKMIGKEDGELYLLSSKSSSKDVNFSASCSVSLIKIASNLDIALWHKKFAHVASSVLKKLLSSDSTSITDTMNKCTICPCAKQTRISFPINTSKNSTCFDLLHMNLWGQYKTPTHDGHKYFLTIVVTCQDILGSFF